MKHLDSGSGLWTDHAALSPVVSFDDIFAKEDEQKNVRFLANARKPEPDHLDVPNLFAPVEPDPAAAEEKHDAEEKKEREQREARRERRNHEEKNDDWFKGACDWLGGAVDVATQVVVGAAESVVEAVTERPMETLGMLAGGLAIGVCIGAAAPVAGLLGASAAVLGGVTLATDAVVVGLTAMGAVHAGHSVIKAVEASSASADVLMHKSEYSIAEIDAAREQVQDVTGDAAIEAGFTLTMAGLSVGNGVRLVEGAGKALKIKPASAAEETLAMADEVAPAASDSNVQRLEELESVDVQSEVMAEIKRGRRKAEALWFKSTEAEAGTLREIPLDTAPELLQKIDKVIEQREAKLDLESMKKRLDELDSVPDPEILISDGASGTRRLTPEELYEPTKTYKRLEGTSQLEEYEVFLRIWRERLDARRIVEDELALRRGLVEDVINENSQLLFPDSTVPILKVKAISETSGAEASYSRGAIKVKDEFLYKPSYERPVGVSSERIDAYVHEITHGEQDGLMVRNLIDLITGGDTTGRRLTSNEIDDIIKLGKDKVGTEYPRELVEDINYQRSGRVLKQEEIARAEKLQAAEKANRTEAPRHREERDYHSRLKQVVERIEEGDIPPDFFTPEYQLKLFGSKEIPEKFDDYNYIFESLLKPHVGNYNAQQQAIAANLKTLVLGELRYEKELAFIRVLLNQSDYRGWHHEKEAWRIGEQAGKQVTEREILQGDRMQSWMDNMTRNPVDYTDVLPY